MNIEFVCGFTVPG